MKVLKRPKVVKPKKVVKLVLPESAKGSTQQPEIFEPEPKEDSGLTISLEAIRSCGGSTSAAIVLAYLTLMADENGMTPVLTRDQIKAGCLGLVGDNRAMDAIPILSNLGLIQVIRTQPARGILSLRRFVVNSIAAQAEKRSA